MSSTNRSAARRFRRWRRRRTRRRAIALSICLAGAATVAVVLSGTFGDPSSEQSYKKAVAYRQSGEFSATIIELKNALRKDPQNTAARISLGQTYLRLSDLLSAEKELRRALEFGADPSEALEPLARSLLLQAKYQQVLEEIWPDGLAAGAGADVYVARGRAYAGLNQPEKAQEAFQQALQIVPQHLNALLETARLAIKRNETAGAHQALRRIRTLSPENLEAAALQGDLYLKTGQYAEAAEQYRAVMAQLPGHILTKVALAEAYFHQGLEDDAAKLLDEALQQAPGNFDANYLKAAIAMKTKDYGTALKRAKRALVSNNSHVPSLVIVGSAAFALEQPELAEFNLNKVVALHPDHKVANKLLSALRERRATISQDGRAPRQADQSFARLIDDSADPALVASAIDTTILVRQALRSGLAYLAEHRRSTGSRDTVAQEADELADARQLLTSDGAEDAFKQLKIRLAEAPGSLPTRALLGEAYLRRGQAEEAYRLVETELIQQAENRAILTIEAIASLATNRPDAARLALRSLDDPERPTAEVHYLLALAYNQLGNVAAYDERLNRSLAVSPQYAPAISERARFALAQTHLDQAEGEIQKLKDLWPDRPEFFDLSAGLSLLRGQTSNAAQVYRQAFDAEPTSIRALRLAYAENRSGKSAASEAVLKDWLSQHPDDAAVALVLANRYLTSQALVDAAELYAIILRHHPNHIVALNNLAWISLQLGDHEAAVKFARQGLALSPDNVHLMETMAEIQLAEGNNAEALSLLNRAIDHDQDNPGLRVKLARSLAQNGSRAEARDLLRQTLTAHREFPERRDAERLSAELEE